jgi:HEAT repeat protein
VTWFAFSPDGRSLAYRDGRAVRLWEVASGADRLSVELAGEPGAVAFTRDGRALLVASGEVVEVRELRRESRPQPNATAGVLWAHLTGADAHLAFRAVEALAADPDRAVPLVRGKLRAVPDFGAQVEALVRRLGDEDFARREGAEAQLAAVGPDAGAALRRAAAKDPSPEVRTRAARLLRRLPADAARPTTGEVRAVEVLEKADTPEARAALAALAARDADSPLKREAAAALARLRGARP